MTNYKIKKIINPKNGKEYIYHYWQYKDQLGIWKYEQAPSLEELNIKVAKRKEILCKGSNSLKPFEEYTENFLRTVHFNTLADKSKERYLSTLNCHLKNSFLGRTKMFDLTPSLVQNFYNSLSPNIAKEARKIISTTLTHAQFSQDISFVYVPHLFTLPRESPETLQKKAIRNKVRPLTQEEHQRFVINLAGHPLEALFRMAIDTGMRPGELYAITWSDIDFDRLTLSINKSGAYTKGAGKYYGWLVGPVKYNVPRTNRLPKVLVPILKKHKEKQNEYLSEIGITQSPDTLVFSTQIGTHLDPSNTLKTLKRIYASLKISEKHVLHDLRHTYATRQFEAGLETLVVSQLLGHVNISTTLETYIHVLQNIKDATADTTDAFYSKFQCQ